MVPPLMLSACFNRILVRISGAHVSIVTMTSKKSGDNETSDSARKRVSLQQNTRSTNDRLGRLIRGCPFAAGALTRRVLNPVNAARSSPTNERRIGYKSSR